MYYILSEITMRIYFICIYIRMCYNESTTQNLIIIILTEVGILPLVKMPTSIFAFLWRKQAFCVVAKEVVHFSVCAISIAHTFYFIGERNMKAKHIMILIIIAEAILLFVFIKYGVTLGVIPMSLFFGFAIKTGKNMQEEKKQEEVAQRAAERGEIPANTWRCSCGKINSSFVAVCPCGKNKPVSAAANSWICSCGKSNPSYTSTCSCGKNKREVLLANSKTKDQ